MIVEQNLGNRVRHYSDEDFYILQKETGELYEDAVDVIPCHFTYEETDQQIIREEDEATVEDYQAALQRLGVV